MKIILTFLFISINLLLANDLLHQPNHSEKGCTIPFFETKKISCSSETKKKTQNSESKRKKQINTILHKVKKYKEKTDNEKKQLQEKLDTLQKKFKRYKSKKKREIAQINTQLKITKKKLSKNRKKLLFSQKKKKVVRKKLASKKRIHKKRIRKKIAHKKIIHKKTIHKRIVQKKVLPKKKTLRKKIVIQKSNPLPIVKNLPWVEIVVEDNINIYQLALKYYGDRQKYREIYAANQHLIGKNFKIYNGMSLKIPMTNQFEEQPMILNTQ